MPLKYKIDIIEALKDKGITTYKIRKENILGQATISNLNQKKPISWSNIEKICEILNCQVGDILEYIPNDKSKEKNNEKQ